MAKIAMCPCGEPYVMTFLYVGHEFYCVQCGNVDTFLGPRAVEPTPALDARTAELRATFQRLCDGIMVAGGYHRDCPTCSAKHEQHYLHATDAEIEADKAARRRLLDHIEATQNRASA